MDSFRLKYEIQNDGEPSLLPKVLLRRMVQPLLSQYRSRMKFDSTRLRQGAYCVAGKIRRPASASLTGYCSRDVIFWCPTGIISSRQVRSGCMA